MTLEAIDTRIVWGVSSVEVEYSALVIIIIACVVIYWYSSLSCILTYF